MTLEQGTLIKVEGTQESTPPETKPTEKGEDFQRAVSKGLEKMQRQLDLQKAEANKYKAEATKHEAAQKHSQAYIESLKKEMEKLSSSIDDEDVRKAYVSSISSVEREMKIAEREADAESKLYEAEKLAWSARMSQKARELHDETGIEVGELENCQTEEEMEVKALRFSIAKPQGEGKTPKFDSNLPTGGGPVFTNQSIAELRNKIAKSNNLKEMEEAMAELDKAISEGRYRP